MSDLTRRQAALLAALLDADGDVVPYWELGAVVGSAGVNDAPVIRRYVRRLQDLGVRCVQIVPRRGCRLTEVPPDWTLDAVLAMLDTMRRDGFCQPVWQWGRTA